MTQHPAYDRLCARFSRTHDIEGAIGVLDWDRAVMMPLRGGAQRGRQLAALSVVAHELMTAPAVAEDLAAAADEPLDEIQAADLRLMRRAHAHASALPADLVEARVIANSHCELAWREARPKNDFQAVAPLLSEVLRLTREAATAKGEALGLDPYDALLDQYEPGGRMAWIAPVFDRLAAELPGLIDAVIERQSRAPAPVPLEGPFPVAAQRGLGRDVMVALGFDFAAGRLDESTHPFCGGGGDDIRLTSRYVESDVLEGLFSVLHETGHALYEAGLPAEWRGRPIGNAAGMMTHESQSLLVERVTARTDAFLGFLSGQLAARFGDQPGFAASNLAGHIRQVRRSLIRTEADEVTYPAHVILRTRLESAMIRGDLAIADLPAAWGDGLEALLGIRPSDDRDGCLQDIHWMDGAFGYFPTYSLGALAAAQLWQRIETLMPDLDARLAEGDFAPVLAWLRQAIHAQGSRHEARELIRLATGTDFSADAHLAHIRRRYLAA